jgi:hypothetical protein
VLYLGVSLVIVTDKGTDWPLWIFWLGVALSTGAAAHYVARARRTLVS